MKRVGDISPPAHAGSPAFVWAHPRHAERFQQPLSGWMGHAAPFEFTPRYRPAAGIERYLCGTPALLSMAALECSVDRVLAAEPFGGMAALRGSRVAVARAEGVGVARAGNGAYAIVQALIACAVIGDFRAPDVLRFGLTPLDLRFVDVRDTARHLQQLLDSGEWRETRFERKAAVT